MMDTTVIWGMVLTTSFVSIIIWSHLLLNTPILQAQWLEETPYTGLEFPSSGIAKPNETSGSMG